MTAKVTLPHGASAEQIAAAAELVRAYNARSELPASIGFWFFLTVLLVLVFRCNGVALWS